MKLFERHDDSKLHSYIGSDSSLLLQKILSTNNTYIIVFFDTFRVLFLPQFFFTNIFVLGKTFFVKILEYFLILKNKKVSRVHWQTVIYTKMILTNRPCNNKHFYVFRNFSSFQEWQNLILGVTKLRFYLLGAFLLFHAGWANAQ